MKGHSISIGFEENLHQLAQRSKFAKRLHPLTDEEDGSCLRSHFARDRDRIIFSMSFRRLIHKTQLYISREGNEHKRTRLTHTMEVAQIARAMSKNLGMNEELVEAIAYGHDVGHAPFGHAGEKQIDLFLRGHEALSGRIRGKFTKPDVRNPSDFNRDFKHNFQSIRILTFLENYHDKYDGLNLTIHCLEGILKHTSLTRKYPATTTLCLYPGANTIFKTLQIDKPYSITVEGQIVSIADEIAQVAHDINDALTIKAISFDDLYQGAIKKILDGDEMRCPALIDNCSHKNAKRNAQAMSCLLNYLITFAITEFKTKIGRVSKDYPDGKSEPIELTEWLLTDNKLDNLVFAELRKLKDDFVLNNYMVNRMDSKGEYIIRKLFDAYRNNPRQLPDAILHKYIIIKKNELVFKGDSKFKGWFTDKSGDYGIKALHIEELEEIVTFIKSLTNGHQFRLLRSSLMEKLTPYLCVDADYLRSVADHIASMTDSYAEEEFGKLYRNRDSISIES